MKLCADQYFLKICIRILSPSAGGVDKKMKKKEEEVYEDGRKELITDRRDCSPVLNREEWHDCNGINSSV